MATRERECAAGLDLNSLGLRLLNVVETSQQRHERLERNRTRNAEARAAETPQQRQTRLERNRTRNAEARAAETPEQRQARLENVVTMLLLLTR
jgi:hypothetical protein